jgi:CheY-like chemotaxis protein
MGGLELCRRLKNNPDTASIPVIFISGRDDIDIRVACFEAGGEDFICKPVEPVELKRKIMHAREAAEQRMQLSEMAGFAQHTAFTAMSGLSELGVVIAFMRKSFACTDDISLAGLALDALDQYGLAGSIQVRSGDESITVSAEGVNLPLEVSVLSHMKSQGRIFEFKDHGVYNYGGITLLVKNMPIQDAERCGRLRDDLAMLAEGADARRQAIELERRNRQTKEGISSALTELHVMLTELQTSQTIEQGVSNQIMSEMQQALVNAFTRLGLTERQEAELADLIRHYFENLRDHHEFGQVVTHRLGLVAERLKRLA